MQRYLEHAEELELLVNAIANLIMLMFSHNQLSFTLPTGSVVLANLRRKLLHFSLQFLHLVCDYLLVEAERYE